jgi:hypothetical protein
MRSLAALVCAASAFGGCGGGHDGPDPPAGTGFVRLSISDAGPMSSRGETRSVTAVVKDVAGAPLPSPSVSWRTSSPGIATVPGSGTSATVTAVDDGVATITATSGTASGEVLTARRLTYPSMTRWTLPMTIRLRTSWSSGPSSTSVCVGA